MDGENIQDIGSQSDDRCRRIDIRAPLEGNWKVVKISDMQQWGPPVAMGAVLKMEKNIFTGIFLIRLPAIPADSGLQSITKTGTEKQSLRHFLQCCQYFGSIANELRKDHDEKSGMPVPRACPTFTIFVSYRIAFSNGKALLRPFSSKGFFSHFTVLLVDLADT